MAKEKEKDPKADADAKTAAAATPTAADKPSGIPTTPALPTSAAPATAKPEKIIEKDRARINLLVAQQRHGPSTLYGNLAHFGIPQKSLPAKPASGPLPEPMKKHVHEVHKPAEPKKPDAKKEDHGHGEHH
jgi:hypothetical protein